MLRRLVGTPRTARGGGGEGKGGGADFDSIVAAESIQLIEELEHRPLHFSISREFAVKALRSNRIEFVWRPKHLTIKIFFFFFLRSSLPRVPPLSLSLSLLRRCMLTKSMHHAERDFKDPHAKQALHTQRHNHPEREREWRKEAKAKEEEDPSTNYSSDNCEQHRHSPHVSGNVEPQETPAELPLSRRHTQARVHAHADGYLRARRRMERHVRRVRGRRT